MTGRARRHAVVCALGLALCLIAARPPQVVGDGGEYIVYALNFASLHGPSLARTDLDRLKQAVLDYAPEHADEDFYRNAVRAPRGGSDFMHFWFYSLAAAPFVWIGTLVGLPAVYGFAALNVAMLLGALWLALPRLGPAMSLLIFGSPIVWWLDKAHTEVFTFSLLAAAFLLLRERPWWSMVASGAVSTQYPPVAVMVALVAGLTVAFDRAKLADRRFLLGVAGGLLLALLHPAYYYVRHGTPSLLLVVANSGMPGLAEISAVLIDPLIGLVPNFPIFAVIVVTAIVVTVRRRPRELLSADVIASALISLVLLWVFGRKDNVHHGATPSLSRYALWFIPLAIPLLRADRIAGEGWRRLVVGAATISAVICVFAFHPSIGQNGREPTWAADYLWTRHPGWNNPLPEVFTETYLKTEAPTAPTFTPGCEKILAGGRGASSAWPVPCFPADTPIRCRGIGVWCYANREGAGYVSVPAPGRWNRPAEIDEGSAWPADAVPVVRKVYREWAWWDLRQNAPGLSWLRSFHRVRVDFLAGPDRFILVLRRPQPDAALTFRLPGPMSGVLVDAHTGETLQTLHFDGQAMAAWEVAIPARSDLQLLALRR